MNSVGTGDKPTFHRTSTWSGADAKVARALFNDALKKELDEVMQEAKRLAAQVNKPTDLWDMESYLTERRKHIDRKYDSRWSQRCGVLGRLLYERRIREQDLRGLSEDKAQEIRSWAKVLSDVA